MERTAVNSWFNRWWCGFMDTGPPRAFALIAGYAIAAARQTPPGPPRQAGARGAEQGVATVPLARFGQKARHWATSPARFEKEKRKDRDPVRWLRACVYVNVYNVYSILF
eukprot:1008798-Prymnesium_polylepis.2